MDELSHTCYFGSDDPEDCCGCVGYGDVNNSPCFQRVYSFVDGNVGILDQEDGFRIMDLKARAIREKLEDKENGRELGVLIAMLQDPVKRKLLEEEGIEALHRETLR